MIYSMLQDVTYPPTLVCPDCGCALEQAGADCEPCENQAADQAGAPRPAEIARMAANLRATRAQDRAAETPADVRVYAKTVVSTAGLVQTVRGRLA